MLLSVSLDTADACDRKNDLGFTSGDLNIHGPSVTLVRVISERVKTGGFYPVMPPPSFYCYSKTQTHLFFDDRIIT